MSEEFTIAQGIAAYQAGNTAEAKRILAQAIKTESDDAEGWYYLGMTQTDPEKRRHCFRRALTLNPAYTEAQQALDAVKDSVPNVITASFSGSKAGGVKIPQGIPGAPSRINLETLVSGAQDTFKDSANFFTQKPATTPSTLSWWNIVFSVAVAGLIIGVILDLRQLIQVLKNSQYGIQLNLINLITTPFLTVLSALIAVGAAAFLSHWYITTQRGAKSDLLAHSELVARAWVAGSLLLALWGIVETILEARALQFWSVVRAGITNTRGEVLIMTLVSAAIALYAAFLLVKSFKRLYPAIADNHLWITALIAIAVSAFVF